MDQQPETGGIPYEEAPAQSDFSQCSITFYTDSLSLFLMSANTALKVAEVLISSYTAMYQL